MNRPILHGYWRSTASWRVRIALAIKGVGFDRVTHDLRRAEQHTAAYRSLAPQGLVPALEVDGVTLTQSLAILEWIEESFPAPPLLPASVSDRALVRGMLDLIACDIHPLNNLRVLQALRDDLDAGEDRVLAWIGRWIGDGFFALERLVERHGGDYAFGDAPSLADCALIPQVYSARRFGVDLANFPRLMAIDDRAARLPAFVAAHPEAQPDADPSVR